MDKNPFSLFDFLGYFVPGALALFFIVLFQEIDSNLFIKNYFNIDSFATSENNISLFNKDLSLLNIAFYIIIAYTFGHLLSFISALFIEKYTLFTYGYPSKLLLYECDSNDDEDMRFLRPNRNLKKIIIAGVFPVFFIDYALRKILKYEISYTKCIGQPYKELILISLENIFKTELKYNKELLLKNIDFHKFLIHFCYEKTKFHQTKLMNYVSLYGFLRVVTLIMNYLSIYLTYYALKKSIKNFTENYYFILLLPLLYIISYLFYLAYLKFYRRYSQENLMILLIK